MQNREKLKSEIDEIISSFRAIIMDSAELAVGNTPDWKFLRARLLKAFGPRGLTGRLHEALDRHFPGGIEND